MFRPTSGPVLEPHFLLSPKLESWKIPFHISAKRLDISENSTKCIQEHISWLMTRTILQLSQNHRISMTSAQAKYIVFVEWPDYHSGDDLVDLIDHCALWMWCVFTASMRNCLTRSTSPKMAWLIGTNSLRICCSTTTNKTIGPNPLKSRSGRSCERWKGQLFFHNISGFRYRLRCIAITNNGSPTSALIPKPGVEKYPFEIAVKWLQLQIDFMCQ